MASSIEFFVLPLCFAISQMLLLLGTLSSDCRMGQDVDPHASHALGSTLWSADDSSAIAPTFPVTIASWPLLLLSPDLCS